MLLSVGECAQQPVEPLRLLALDHVGRSFVLDTNLVSAKQLPVMRQRHREPPIDAQWSRSNIRSCTLVNRQHAARPRSRVTLTWFLADK